MSNEQYYEVSGQTDFETKLSKVNLEDVLGLFYNTAEVEEKFGVYPYNTETVVLNKTKIISVIGQQILKDATVPYESFKPYGMSSANKEFAPHGFKFSVSKMAFVRQKYVAPVVTTELTKNMKKAIMRMLHRYSEIYLSRRFNLYDVTIKANGEYDQQANVVYMAKKLGATLKDDNLYVALATWDAVAKDYIFIPRSLEELIKEYVGNAIPDHLKPMAAKWIRAWWKALTKPVAEGTQLEM